MVFAFLFAYMHIIAYICSRFAKNIHISNRLHSFSAYERKKRTVRHNQVDYLQP